MKASQLRDLTRKYAGNELSREEYLAERTRLIDGMVSGEIKITYRELEAANMQPRVTGKQRWKYTGGTIFLVALLFIALAAYFFDAGSSPDARPTVVEAPITNPGTILLTEFLRSDDWSDESIEQLETQWLEISVFHQEGARRSSGFRRLKNEARQRVREQEALLASGEPEALLRIARLRNFSQTMGFENDNH